MKFREVSAHTFLAVLAIFVAVALTACGGSNGPSTPKCIRPSDCAGQLLCVEGYCVAACTTSKDCMGGKERCIVTSGGTTCEPPETTTCHFNSQCTDPLVCADDGQCRNQCLADKDCASGQRCTSITKLCADPTLDSDYDPAANDFTYALDGGADGRTTADGPKTDAPEADGGADASADVPTSTDGAAEHDGGASGDGPTNFCAVDAGGLASFRASNLPATLAVPSAASAFVQADDATFDTDALTLTGPGAGATDGGGVAPPAMVVSLSDGDEAAVLFFTSYTLAANKTLSVTGQRPLIIVASDDILVGGTISTVQSATNGWCGGGPPGPNTAGRAGVCADDGANGGGAPGGLDPASAFGAGGGGYCGPGGHGSAPASDGGADAAVGPAGGQPYGTPALVPLLGGSSGGSASLASLSSNGGGAVELVAGTSLTVDLTGVINMAGRGYVDNTSSNGAGSGGAILLEAPTITVRGTLAANGGNGSVLTGGYGGNGQPSDQPSTEQRGNGGQGSAATVVAGGDAKPNSNFPSAGGGGGAGRIRINTGCGGTLKVNSGAIISPSVGTSCTTTGTLVAP